MNDQGMHLASSEEPEPPLPLEGLPIKTRKAIERFLCVVEIIKEHTDADPPICGNYISTELKNRQLSGRISPHMFTSPGKVASLNHELAPVVSKLFLTPGDVFTYDGSKLSGLSALGRDLHRKLTEKT